ncbi:MAG: hypothetical protein E6778_12760 [Niallia nealsonii]|nr:hypothetical protein [Niallia nealsonii]
MTEEHRPIEDYEDLYAVTKTGRIINLKNNSAKVYCGDEYGFPKVHLYRNGSREPFNVFELWKKAFPELNRNEFKGAIKRKYGAACSLLDRKDISSK